MFFIKKIIIQTKFILPILLIISFFFFLIKDKSLMADEVNYYPLIERITNLKIDKDILYQASSLPGYVSTIGLLRLAFNITDVQGTRLITTIFSFLSICIFYFTAKEFDPKNAKIKTLQYLFLPILFIYLFLIYTDIFSLFLVLLSFYFLIKGKYSLSSLVGFFSLLAKQNNIIWIMFFCTYIFIKKREDIRNALLYLPSFVAIIIFIAVNKGGAVGSMSQSYQPLAIHLQNIFFALFLFFFLFFPLNISNFPKIINLLKTNYKMFIFLAILILGYVLTFKIDHPFNQSSFNYFIRNRILDFSTKNTFNKIIFLLPIMYSLLSLFVIRMKEKFFYFVYLFIFISLSIFWLIEARYYLPALTFFILFKKEESKLVEYSTILMFIAISVYIFIQTINHVFFL